MSRTVFLIVIIYCLLLAGLVGLHQGLLSLALPFCVYLLAGIWWSPEKPDLEIQRTLSKERAAPGEEVQVRLEVTNHGVDVDELLLEDVLPARLALGLGTNRLLLSLKKGDSYTWTYTVQGPRGDYLFKRLETISSDVFSLRPLRQDVTVNSQFFVFPSLVRLKHIPIRTRNTRAFSGIIPARVGGSGVEFFGLREYQPGDSPRSINWRASARFGEELYANLFQLERVADVGIVLDGREKTNLFHGGRSLFEYLVLAAASLADAFLFQGNRVGLLHYGRYVDWTLPGYGKVQRERILQALAHAQPGGSPVFSGLEHIPARFFPAHSQIVLVSPLDPNDLDVLIQLRARGYQVMVVSPDPVAYELSCLPGQPAVQLAARIVRMERNLSLQRLQRAGVQVLDWDITQPFDQVLKSRLGPPPALLHTIGMRL